MTISIVKPNPSASTAFTLSGVLSGYTVPPKLSYTDNPHTAPVTGIKQVSATKTSITLGWNAVLSSWVSLPTGATVTANSFSFTHPALPVGTYVTDVSNGSELGTTTYTISSTQPTVASILAEVSTLQTQVSTMQTLIAQIKTDLGKLP